MQNMELFFLMIVRIFVSIISHNVSKINDTMVCTIYRSTFLWIYEGQIVS